MLRLRPTSLVLSRSAQRLPLAGDAAQARARGARALEELAGVVEVAVEAAKGVGVVVGVVVGVRASVAAVEAEEAAAVAVGAEEPAVATVVEVSAAAVALVGVALRRGAAPVVVNASSSSVLVIEVKGVVTSVSRDLDNMHGLVEGMVSGNGGGAGSVVQGWNLEDTKLASLEQKQDIATRGVLLLCSFVSRGLQGNPGNQELLKVRWGSFGGLWGLAHMPQMAVLQSATGKGITLQLSPALPCAPAICFPLILSGPGGHGLADMSQMAVPQLAAGKGAPAGGAVGLSGLKELEFISSALESSVHHTVVLSGLKELEFLSSAFESSPWCTTQWGCGCVAGEIVGSGASVGGAVGQWGSGAISLSGLKKLEFISSALESSVHHSGNLPLDPAYTYQPTRQASYQASTAERGMHGAAAAHGLHTAAPAAAQGLHASGATAEAAVVQSVREAGDVVLRRGVVIEEVGDGREGCGRPRPANEVSPPRAREGVPGGYPPRKLRHARFGD
ncbi:unnamed protein product [Closterium sp. NIES-64]|nr:unnamed protein product [Closterium sp. NIES-64]